MTRFRKNLKAELEKHPFPFSDFMEILKRNGFTIGVDHYLRLHTLLARLEPDVPVERLKSILCPLFAASVEQQRRFGILYDQYADILKTTEQRLAESGIREDVKEKAAEPVSVRTWIYWAAFFLLLTATALIVWDFHPEPVVVKPKTVTVAVPDTGGETPNIEEERLPNITDTIPLGDRSPGATFYQKYGETIRWTAVVVPILISLLVLMFRSARRKFALEKSAGKSPPYVWPIRVETARPPFFSEKEFYGTAARMRRRILTDILRPDVNKTVSETVRNAGYPTFIEKALTRPPEYLVLIDLASENDHQARFVQSLADTLQAEGIFVRRYFFSGDPQVCFAEPDQPRVHLSVLSSRFPGRRLVLVGDGDSLVHPITGRPEPWLEQFEPWPERVLFTFKKTSEWGRRETDLAAWFLVLPASIDSLSEMVKWFEKPDAEAPVPENGKKRFARFALNVRSGDVEAIRERLPDEQTFQWLCACAVYPELSWGLTLYLGMLDGGEITEQRLLALIRLPWFRTGSLPDDLRVGLLDRLDNARLRQIRKAIFDVLKNDPPPEGTVAREFYELNLAVERWMVSPKNREYLKKIRDNEALLTRDYTTVKILDGASPSRLSLVLPQWLRKRLFRKGSPLFGLRSGVWAALALFASFSLYLCIPAPTEPVASVTREIVMVFTHVPAGTFTMGSPDTEPGHENNEKLHDVTLTKGFYMQTTEVTQKQWTALMGENPSYFKKCGQGKQSEQTGQEPSDCPVEQVSWDDAKEFIRRLNRQVGEDRYRLPTEAEWERACRGGTQTALYTGPIEILGDNNAPALDPIAWYGGNSCADYEGAANCKEDDSLWKDKQEKCDKCGTQPVAQKKPNQFGLYDMLGNVWEWCEDWYGEYPEGPVENYVNNEKSAYRVLRGGSWIGSGRDCRCAYRGDWPPFVRLDDAGFRLARSLP